MERLPSEHPDPSDEGGERCRELNDKVGACGRQTTRGQTWYRVDNRRRPAVETCGVCWCLPLLIPLTETEPGTISSDGSGGGAALLVPPTCCSAEPPVFLVTPAARCSGITPAAIAKPESLDLVFLVNLKGRRSQVYCELIGLCPS